MKLLISIFLIFNFTYAAMIATGKKQEAGTFLLSNYYISFESDTIRDSSNNVLLRDYAWREQTYALKPVYYTDNFLFSLTVPYRKMQRGFTDEKIYGLLDVTLGLGYFIPNSYGDLLWLSRVQLPTGKFDKNKLNVYFGTIPALQMGSNRYELQEELHFFKPVIDTKIPFLIDGALIYHLRGKDLNTKQKNGYYFGAELTLSAILSRNFFIGPAVYYKKYDIDGILPDIGSSKYQYGLGSLYKINDNNSFALEYVKDYKAKNRLEGSKCSLRYVYKF